MKVPIEWLKEYVPVRLSPTQLAHRLTMAGLEVVGVLDVDGQPVLDLEITPNRADCLSIIGVAREVAAITGQRLKLPSAQGSGSRARGQRRQPTARSPQPRPSVSNDTSSLTPLFGQRPVVLEKPHLRLAPTNFLRHVRRQIGTERPQQLFSGQST